MLNKIMQRASTEGGVRVDESATSVRVSECMYAGAIKSDMTQLMSIKVDLKIVDVDAIYQAYTATFTSGAFNQLLIIHLSLRQFSQFWPQIPDKSKSLGGGIYG